MIPLLAAQGWSSLVVHVVGGNVRHRSSEWNALVSERPESISIEAFGIVGWVTEQTQARGREGFSAAVPVHEHERAKLADARETPTGAIRLGSRTFANRGLLAKTLLADCQRRWDDAHPIRDASDSPSAVSTDEAPQK